MSGTSLVTYAPVKRTTSVLVPGVGTNGPLALGPEGNWIAIEQTRRWDGLDITDIVFVNLMTKQVWRLAKQAGQEIHILPISWNGQAVVFADDGVYLGDASPQTYELDLSSGKVAKTADVGVSTNWAEFSKPWRTPMRVPNPKSTAGVSSANRFWHLGKADVSVDGNWAVAWLQPDWPAPGVGDSFPVYLLSKDGAYRRLPLERPVVFARTLGVPK